MSTKKKKHLWKFLNTGMKSAHGEQTWKIGEWGKLSGELIICEKGFHASEYIQDAFWYVHGSVLARVEVRGESVIRVDKQAWSEMRVVEAYHWSKFDSVRMAIFTARAVLPIYERRYPKKTALRGAIEAAEAWLVNQCNETREAAPAAAAKAAAAHTAAYAGVREQLQKWCENHVKNLKVHSE